MKPKIKEILFDAFSVVCVLVGFSIHGLLSLCFLLVGSVCGAFALYFTLSNHRVHEVTESQARGWAMMLFVISTVGGVLYWRQCKLPEQQPYPVFQFELYESDNLHDGVWLTNDFLTVTKYSDNVNNPFTPCGILFLPSRGGSNVLLRIFLKNNAPDSDAVSGEVSVGMTEVLNPVPAYAWEEQLPGGQVSVNLATGGTLTNIPKRFAYFLPRTLLRGESMEIPPIQIAQIDDFCPSSTMVLEARSAGSPAESVVFTVFSPKNTPYKVNKPFVIKGENTGTNFSFSIPGEKVGVLIGQGFMSPK